MREHTLSNEFLWDDLHIGEPVILRTTSPLHRDAYPVRVIGRRADRLRLSFPMKQGQIVLLPVGTSVALSRSSEGGGEVWTKLVQRLGGPDRSVLLARPCPETPLVAEPPRGTRAPMIALASGKGGVGTTVLALNVAAAMAATGKSVCLVDAVPGVGNADVLLNVHARWNLTHVIQGDRSPFEAATRGPGSLLLIAGGQSGPVAGGPWHFEQLTNKLQLVARHVDAVVIDAGTGVGPSQAALLARADERVIVTTAEPHSVTDAYALLHAASRWESGLSAHLVINKADGAEEAETIARRMEFAASRFLGVQLQMLAAVPRDRTVEKAVRRQELFVRTDPRSAASVVVREIARKLVPVEPHREYGDGERSRRRRWRFRWRRSRSPVSIG